MTELRGTAAPSLAELLDGLDPVDLVLVEGSKTAPHPRVECHRAAGAHRGLLAQDNATIRAVASDSILPGLALPLFDLDETAAITGFILAETGLT